jgi:hypothetical protein
MMRMNGLKSSYYYISHFVTFYILYAVSTAVFLVSGKLSKLSFFSATQPSVLLLLFAVWGLNQIVLAFFLATLFNKSRLAQVATFL